MSNPILDILTRNNPSPGTSEAGSVGVSPSPANSTPTPANFTPANSSTIVERFRSVTSHMQATADMSVAQEIKRICALPIIKDPTEEEIELVSRWFCPDGYFKLFPLQVKAMMEFYEYGSILCPIPVGGGKCVEGDTEIFDLNTGRRRVDELGDLNILSINNSKIFESKKAKSFSSGMKYCVRLTLMSGQSVGLSVDHPVLTHRGWVEAGKLLSSDLIATPRLLSEPIEYYQLSDDEVKVSAYLAADGGTSTNMPAFTNMDDRIINDLNNSVISLGGSLTEQKSESRARQFYVKGIFRYRGILYNKELARHKRVPPKFYLLPKRQIALYLNRFWACDGHIRALDNKLEIILASEGLINDLRFMLLRLGILSRKRYKKTSYVKKGIRKFFNSWRLIVSGKPNIIKFLTKIGYPLGKEIRSQKLFNNILKMRHNTNTDIVPIGSTEFKEICDELGYQGRGGNPSTRKNNNRTILSRKLGVTSGQYLSRDMFNTLIKLTGYDGKYSDLASSDIAWEKIDRIYSRGDRAVYDLSVPETYNFIGNGVVLHNSLISVLVPNEAYTRFGKSKILLMTPPHLIDQLQRDELPYYRRHISINMPIYWLTKESRRRRMLSAQSGRKGCYVLSYSMISGSEGAELIDAIQPDLVVGDEIHKIASARSSARNRRFKSMVRKYSPALVSMSGTLSTKTPKDYHWLAVNTLQERSPLPRPVMCADQWASIIDSNASSIDEFNPNSAPQPGPIKPLIDWAKYNFSKESLPNNLIGFRRAYKLRLFSCPGVVGSESHDDTVPLRISNIPISKEECESRPGWDKLQDLVDTLINEYIAPNGDEIDHAMHIWRWRYELEGFGFYNNLFWPEAIKISARKEIPLSAAQDLIDRSVEHHELKQEYHKVLRRWIKHRAKTGMDTPMLLGNEMYRNQDKNVGLELYSAWKNMHEADFKGILEREKEVIRICDFRIKKIVEWAKAWYKKRPNQAAIVWMMNTGVGIWLYEAFQEAGLPVIHCHRGKKGKALLEDRSLGNYFAITTLHSYREGLNLQHHHDTEFFAQWPRSASWAQQSMGRIPRVGQKSDQARYFTSISSNFDKMLFASTLNDAAYAHQTGNAQKLMYADYDERPMVVPYSALLQWSGGSNVPVQLNQKMQRFLTDKFKGE